MSQQANKYHQPLQKQQDDMLMVSSSNQKHRLVDWIQKQNETICCLQEMHLTDKHTHSHKVKG
jgi:hypothetical protein